MVSRPLVDASYTGIAISFQRPLFKREERTEKRTAAKQTA
nr:MAG TPA: hypothetical protein [Caudoviricetes sp.]